MVNGWLGTDDEAETTNREREICRGLYPPSTSLLFISFVVKRTPSSAGRESSQVCVSLACTTSNPTFMSFAAPSSQSPRRPTPRLST